VTTRKLTKQERAGHALSAAIFARLAKQHAETMSRLVHRRASPVLVRMELDLCDRFVRLTEFHVKLATS